MSDIVTIDSNRIGIRLILAMTIVAVLLFWWYSIAFQIGDMLAFRTPSTDDNAADIADLAYELAPSDPTATWLEGATRNDPATSLYFFEETARLSPDDYHWRVELGRAYEQAGRPVDAETQFVKATSLAPNYAYPHWYLGNFYLRQKKVDAAMAELEKAAANNHFYRDQVFSLVWDYFGKDPNQLERIAGDSPMAHAQLAFFLGTRGEAESSLRNWDRLSSQDKVRFRSYGEPLAQASFGNKAYPQALAFSVAMEFDPTAAAEIVTNGSFESPLNESDKSLFGWVVSRNDPKLEIASDTKVRHDGERALRLSFKGFNKPTLSTARQFVVVKPDQNYELTFWMRTENLKSAAGPLVEVSSANDDKLLARTNQFVGMSGDWTQIKLDIATPANCDAIVIQTVREYCGDDCPISGNLWYDDFELNRL